MLNALLLLNPDRNMSVLRLCRLYLGVISQWFPLFLQVVKSRMMPNSYGGLGLLAVPIGILREQEAERVSHTSPAQLILSMQSVYHFLYDTSETNNSQNILGKEKKKSPHVLPKSSMLF